MAIIKRLQTSLWCYLDALQDFGKPLPEAKNVKRPGNPTGAAANAAEAEMNEMWSEEFIKEATAQFEKKMREYATKGSLPFSTSCIECVCGKQ